MATASALMSRSSWEINTIGGAWLEYERGALRMCYAGPVSA
ncbi:hypothetical protein C4K25_3000 [Pseudomonas chlororaphis]|nr:hypothetical protein C4K25_3000 [Pseudomonas chlororaphis]